MKQEKLFPIFENKLIQQHFVEAIFDHNDADLIQQVRQNSISPEFRINIYRNNILQSLRRTLEITFPNIWKLAGDEYANNLAYAFCQKQTNLPTTHCLDDWGTNFPLYLKKMSEVTKLDYLKDVAALEWLKHKSYRAPNFESLNPLKLQKKLIHGKKLQLIFNPSVYFFSSDYLLKEVIALVENPDEVEKIILQQTPSYAVVFRQYNQVLLRWIEQDRFNFFINIKNGISLLKSYKMIRKSNADFDLTEALQFMVDHQLILNIKIC